MLGCEHDQRPLRSALPGRAAGGGHSAKALEPRRGAGRSRACKGVVGPDALDASGGSARGRRALRLRPGLDLRARPEPCLTPPEGAALSPTRPLAKGWQAGDVRAYSCGALAAPVRAGGEGGVRGGQRMSRPKRMLPVLGQPPKPEAPRDAPSEDAAACCTPGEADACCGSATRLGVAGLRTREADSEMLEGDLARSVVRVEGMDCASCAATVEKRAAALPGMRRAVVNFATGRLDAEHDPGLSVEDIEKAVRDAGYGVGRTEEVERTPFWHTPRAIAVYASALLFALGLALGFLGAPDAARVGAYATAIVVGGLPIFRAALAGVRTKHLDMNVLMSAATVGAVGLGEWAEAASVVVLFAAGSALQVYAIDRTRAAVRALVWLAPDEVLVRRGTGEVVVPADEVGVGETVIVRPGERLAVDGEVVEGASAVDEAPVTGESVPVEKGSGDAVYSGTLNGSGGLLVRATKRVGEEAQAKKAPAEQFVDRFSRVYTPLVVAVAVALAVVPPLLGGPLGEWFYRALALLIIACPCALVISTPVTVVSGIGAASRRGILVKGGATLEAAGRLKALAFDKTGTLTEGRPVVSRVVAL